MFHLAIVFVLLTGNQVSFLSNHFVDGRLICNDGEQTYVATKEGQWTYHSFKLPEGDDWECSVVAMGSGLIFPSQWDMISRRINYE